MLIDNTKRMYEKIVSIPMTSMQGTLAYMSPERITSSEYSYQSDIWSLGATMIAILTSNVPYAEVDGFAGLSEAIQKARAGLRTTSCNMCFSLFNPRKCLETRSSSFIISLFNTHMIRVKC